MEYILEPGKIKENTTIKIPDIGFKIGDLYCVCFDKIVIFNSTIDSFIMEFYKDSRLMASLTARETYKIVLEKDRGYIEPIKKKGGYKIKRHIQIK